MREIGVVWILENTGLLFASAMGFLGSGLVFRILVSLAMGIFIRQSRRDPMKEICIVPGFAREVSWIRVVVDIVTNLIDSPYILLVSTVSVKSNVTPTISTHLFCSVGPTMPLGQGSTLSKQIYSSPGP